MNSSSNVRQNEIVRYRVGCWYDAKVLDVKDKQKAEFQGLRRYCLIVFGVQRSRCLDLAHLHVPFDNNWKARPEFFQLLNQFGLAVHDEPLIESIHELKGKKVLLMFGPQQAPNQPQSICAIEKVNGHTNKRVYKPSWKGCVLCLDIEGMKIKAYGHDCCFKVLDLTQIPSSVKRVLFLFFERQQERKGKSRLLTIADYANIEASRQAYKAPDEALRKAISRTYRWLNDLDKRRDWGKAIEGTPKHGYILKIRITEFPPQSNRTESNLTGNLPPY